jgi:hypothetical protein
MEEIGAVIRFEKDLGNVIAYRDALKLKYVYFGYQCRLIELSKPTTTIDHETGKVGAWEKRTNAINRIQSEIDTIKKDKENYDDLERYHARIFMREVTLVFLKQIQK